MRKAVSKYLYILGIVQLLGLNIGGIFWIDWAKGIREAKPSSRRWVIIIHSLYLALCAGGLIKLFISPDAVNHLLFFGGRLENPSWIVLAFILLLMVIYGLPVIWLMSKKMKMEFMKQRDGEATSDIMRCEESETT